MASFSLFVCSLYTCSWTPCAKRCLRWRIERIQIEGGGKETLTSSQHVPSHSHPTHTHTAALKIHGHQKNRIETKKPKCLHTAFKSPGDPSAHSASKHKSPPEVGFSPRYLAHHRPGSKSALQDMCHLCTGPTPAQGHCCCWGRAYQDNHPRKMS
jgi:hypothetical protein